MVQPVPIESDAHCCCYRKRSFSLHVTANQPQRLAACPVPTECARFCTIHQSDPALAWEAFTSAFERQAAASNNRPCERAPHVLCCFRVQTPPPPTGERCAEAHSGAAAAACRAAMLRALRAAARRAPPRRPPHRPPLPLGTGPDDPGACQPPAPRRGLRRNPVAPAVLCTLGDIQRRRRQDHGRVVLEGTLASPA